MNAKELDAAIEGMCIERFVKTVKDRDWANADVTCKYMDSVDPSPSKCPEHEGYRMLAKVVVHLYDRIQHLEEQLAKK